MASFFNLSNVITSLSAPLPTLCNNICLFNSCRQRHYLFQAPSSPGYSAQSQRRLIPGVVGLPMREEANLLNLSGL